MKEKLDSNRQPISKVGMFSFLCKFDHVCFVLYYISSAEEAIQNMHGTVIGKQTVHISWGKTLANRQISENTSAFTSSNYYEETMKGNTKSAKEVVIVEDTRNVKTKKDEVLDSTKISESVGKVDAGTGEVAAVNDNTHL
ncbi:polyadenylate-binding protein RBP47-like protein [Tanacetum coccineum]